MIRLAQALPSEIMKQPIRIEMSQWGLYNTISFTFIWKFLIEVPIDLIVIFQLESYYTIVVKSGL